MLYLMLYLPFIYIHESRRLICVVCCPLTFLSLYSSLYFPLSPSLCRAGDGLREEDVVCGDHQRGHGAQRAVHRGKHQESVRLPRQGARRYSSRTHMRIRVLTLQ